MGYTTADPGASPSGDDAEIPAVVSARSTVRGFEPRKAAGPLTWGLVLGIASPLLVALAWPTGDPVGVFGEPAPNGALVLVGALVGFASLVFFSVAARRAALNADYVAARVFLLDDGTEEAAGEAVSPPAATRVRSRARGDRVPDPRVW